MTVLYNVEIPVEWDILYSKILLAFAQYGNEALKDCKATCDDKNTHVVDCYNIFNSALAAKHIGNEKQANLLYNYVEKQFNIYYPNLKHSNIIWYLYFSEDDVTDINDYKIESNSFNKIYHVTAPENPDIMPSLFFYVPKDLYDKNPLYLTINNNAVAATMLQNTETINGVVCYGFQYSYFTGGDWYVQLMPTGQK